MGTGLLIFVIIVIVVLALVVYALRSAPIQAPFNWILQILAITVAILIICQRAGLL